ncbi:MAG: DUF255 domain-containing protein, partial [Polyangiaceae bacterium]
MMRTAWQWRGGALLLVAWLAACVGPRGCGDASQAGATSTREGPSSNDPNPALPGLGKGDPALVARLRAALRAKGPSFRPHTRHLRPDGSPVYINRLIFETSPYLLEHANNPVNWFPWSEEAFERARRENKPVFLSIGYSTCHWCHVMERESFEDEAT